MAEHLEIASGDKEEKYKLLYKQIKSLADIEDDEVALMANTAAMIQETFKFLWSGFYRVKDGMLVLGPFQGPLACSRIKYGHGVCGAAWKQSETIVVPDVEKFPGHIACSSSSRSEIVVPIKSGDTVTSVLDIDSAELSTFDSTDAYWLEKITGILSSKIAEIANG